MKIGIAGYPVPPEVGAHGALEWTIDEAARLGVQVVGGHARPISPEEPLRYDTDTLRRQRDLADARGIQIEPSIRRPFDLTGTVAASASAALRANLQACKFLGGPVMRTGYGWLNVETSRFNRTIPIAEHLGQVTANLRVAARIAADEGVVIGVENHFDFTGRELASVLDAVNSPAVRAALDTGNSLTVLCDPAEDVAALAPYTVTTHLKDMQVIQQTQRGLVPFQVVGCALGEGHVDVKETIRVLGTKSPRGWETPLLVELGWVPVEPGVNHQETLRATFARGLDYLRTILTERGR